MTKAENELRKAFFARRNGVVADALRATGDPHRYIMGCQLTDVAQVVSQISQNSQNSQISQDSQDSHSSQDSSFALLAQQLWDDVDHRECRLAATMLYPPDEFPQELALEWARGVETTEVADVLCHRLLRKLSFAPALVEQLVDDKAVLVRYTAFRLLLNLLLMGRLSPTAELQQLVELEAGKAEPLLRPLLTSLFEEFKQQ